MGPSVRLFTVHVLFVTALLGLATSAASGSTPHYDIEARLEPARGQLRGRAVITLPAHAISEKEVRFDVSVGRADAMQIVSIEAASQQPLSFSTPASDGIVTVGLRDATEPATVAIDYTLALDEDARRTFGYYLVDSTGPGSYWYPDIVNPDGSRDRFRDFDVALDYPSAFAVLTTGGPGDTRSEGERVHARYRAEHVEGFAFAAGEEFVVEQYETGKVPIVAFFHPDHADRFETIAAHTAEAVAWYEQTYGFFPTPVVGVVQGHPSWSGGYPLPNVFMVHLGRLDDDYLSFITAHELGHYYWGLHVLADGEERLGWLMLANGIWADQLYLASQNGRSLDEQWRYSGNGDWIVRYLTALIANYDQRLGLTREETRDLGFDYNSLVRHGKGATGLFLQARRIGAERFLELQRQLLEEFRHRPLSVDAFANRLEDAGAVGAPDFFRQWQRGDAQVGAIIDEVVKEGDSTRTVIARIGNVPYEIGIEVDSRDGSTVRHTMEAAAQYDTVRTREPPAAIRLDPDGVVPMWNTSHSGMRSLCVQALGRAGLDAVFIPQALAHLDDVPGDDSVRYALIRRLFEVGRWEEAAELWPGGVCGSPNQCRAGIYAGRALAQLGHTARAAGVLEDLQGDASRFDLAKTWLRAMEEVERTRERE